MSEIKDSGEMRVFKTGAHRDANNGKGDMSLLPWDAIIRVSKHYQNGAIKYGANNWKKGMPISALCDSAMRHLAKYMMGMDDEDHLAAAVWNILNAMHFEMNDESMVDLSERKGKNTFK